MLQELPTCIHESTSLVRKTAAIICSGLVLCLLLSLPSHAAEVEGAECIIPKVEKTLSIFSSAGRAQRREVRKKAREEIEKAAAQELTDLKSKKLDDYFVKETRTNVNGESESNFRPKAEEFQKDFDRLLDIASEGDNNYPANKIREWLKGPEGTQPPYPDLQDYWKRAPSLTLGDLTKDLLAQYFEIKPVSRSTATEKVLHHTRRHLKAVGKSSKEVAITSLKFAVPGAIGLTAIPVYLVNKTKKAVVQATDTVTGAPTEKSIKAELGKISTDLQWTNFNTTPGLSDDQLTQQIEYEKNRWYEFERRYEKQYDELAKVQKDSASSAATPSPSSANSTSNPVTYEKTVDNALTKYTSAQNTYKDALKSGSPDAKKLYKNLKRAEKKLAFNVAYWEYLNLSSDRTGADSKKVQSANETYISDKLDLLLKIDSFSDFATYLSAIQKLMDSDVPADESSQRLADPDFLDYPLEIAGRPAAKSQKK